MVSALRMLTKAVFSGLVQFALANWPHDIAYAIYFRLHVLVLDEAGCRFQEPEEGMWLQAVSWYLELVCMGFQKADFTSFPNGYQPSTL